MPTNDGNVPYASFIVTVASVGYVAENLNPSRPSTIIERRNQLGAPSGQVIIPDFETATMTLQRPTTSTDLPSIGASATIPSGAGLGSGTWYASDVGAAYDAGEVQKFNVTVRKAVG
jgi:hypothetical protein